MSVQRDFARGTIESPFRRGYAPVRVMQSEVYDFRERGFRRQIHGKVADAVIKFIGGIGFRPFLVVSYCDKVARRFQAVLDFIQPVGMYADHMFIDAVA